MGKWLDHSALVQRVVSSSPPLDLSQKFEERIHQLSVTTCKKTKKVVKCDCLKRMAALLDKFTYSGDPSCFVHIPIANEDS